MPLPNNTTILGSVYLAGTSDYQLRVPDPTQSAVTETMEFLFDPMNRRYFNEFMDILVNRIGLVLARQRRWDNRLAAFKDGMMPYGSTVEECGFKWVQAHAYDDNAVDLLRMERPDGVSVFHSQNRQDKYKITINEAELQNAFLDEYGLSNYVSSLMMIPQNSDNYDEYQIMKNLIAEYDTRWGFFRYGLGSAVTNETTAKTFLTAVRTMTGKLQFPTTLYNAQNITDIPVFANPDELVLLLTPEVEGVLDVQALASIFHVEMADINVRRVIMDSMPIEGAVALLTTRDFFMCRDTRYQTATFYDPNTLNTHYFLHHWGIYSVSPLVPAVLFTTDSPSDMPVMTATFDSFTINLPADAASIAPGGTLQLIPAITNTVNSPLLNPSAADLELIERISTSPDSFTWMVRGIQQRGSTRTVEFNTRTYIDKHAVLHLQKTPPAEVAAAADVPPSAEPISWNSITAIAVACMPTSTRDAAPVTVYVPVTH